MLQLEIEISPEKWDQINERFIEPKTVKLQLEHSLVSLSKWESKWCKPFLNKSEKTVEELIDYIKCMTITQNIKDETYARITQTDFQKVIDYINAPMTATTFPDDRKTKSSRKNITSELIYYWMVALNIPFECQKWHLNRLITLIRVCEAENKPAKKLSQRQIMSRNAALNAARRTKLGSKG